jgi:pyruvate,orthophosphate dikinase
MSRKSPVSSEGVLLFDEGFGLDNTILGGKGAGIVEMTRLGLPVPEGVILTTEVFKRYQSDGGLSEDLKAVIKDRVSEVGKRVGKIFGDPSRPLLFSVRSGAPVSMPGMMDTILNVGLTVDTVRGLARLTGDERFAFDSYRRLIQMFGKVVLGVPADKFEHILDEAKKSQGVKLDIELSAATLKQLVTDYKGLLQGSGKPFPDDAYAQLYGAVEAVFKSWFSPRAKVYRRTYGIAEEMGTAVNIQVMVFGNSGPDSATGVGFTRNPSTGENNLYGEFLTNAQGEDVVAGIRTPRPIDEMAKEMPHTLNQLKEISRKLEHHFRDIQDIEFTIEKGELYMLQTRTGKRTAQAAVKVAVDMVKEGLIGRNEALKRVEPDHLSQLLHRHVKPGASLKTIAKGLPASPGAATGYVTFDVDQAAERGSKGEKLILVRLETSPEDIHGMIGAQAILTSRGGMTCHAAVVARGMGKPAIVGCDEIKIDQAGRRFSARTWSVKEGDLITVDGSSGQVILGEAPLEEPELSSEMIELLGWADEARKLGVRANADTPEAAEKARKFGAEGIGLCRTERMFNAQDRLPIVQEMILAETDEERIQALNRLKPLQKEDFRKILRAMAGYPVTIRLLDLPLHEFLPRTEDLRIEIEQMRHTASPELAQKERILQRSIQLSEHNPMLGHRGCRLAIRYPYIYETQVKAILEAASELIKDEGLDVQVEIMLPLVSEARELKILKSIIDKAASEVIASTGVKVRYLVGTMIETPRAALTAKEIAETAQFFSFGTNDLTQTTFAYSRDDAESKFIPKYLEDGILPFNPFESVDQVGVGRLVRIATEEGRKSNSQLKVGICGEHGGDPVSIKFFHQAGLDYVSSSSFRVPLARLAAAQANLD